MADKPHKFSFIDNDKEEIPAPPQANKRQFFFAAASVLFAFSTAILGYKYLDTQNKLDEANEEFSQSLNEVIDKTSETFNDVQLRARDTERRTDINSLATQLEVYYNENGYYPDGSTPGY